MNITKKANKQLKKLPKRVVESVHAADKSETFGTMLRCSSKTRVSIKLPNGYRMIKERDTDLITWVGTHNEYNTLIHRGGRI